jgi:PIN domain nuclease of toxin-antitoxin system
MKQLLDTHTFLWLVNANSKLSVRLRELIEDETNKNFISIASLWEMSIIELLEDRCWFNVTKIYISKSKQSQTMLNYVTVRSK